MCDISKMSGGWGNYDIFASFTKEKNVSDKSVVVFDSVDTMKLAVSAEDKIGNTSRNAGLKESNNAIRTFFKESVLNIFGLVPGQEDRLPPEVKSAMELSDYGKGKPLSARRIRTVTAAIENWDKTTNKTIVFSNDKIGENIKNGLNIFKTSLNKIVNNGNLNKDNVEKKFQNSSEDAYRASRPDAITERSFMENPYFVPHKPNDWMVYLLNGKAFDMQKSINDTTPIIKSANLLLASRISDNREMNVDLGKIGERFGKTNLKDGDFIEFNEDGQEHIEWIKTNLKNAEAMPNGKLAGLVIANGIAKLVTKDEFLLNRVAMSTCNQGSLNIPTYMAADAKDEFGGYPFISNSNSAYSINIIPSSDGSGYEFIAQTKCNSILTTKKERGSNDYTTFYNPSNPTTALFTAIYKIELEDGNPKVSFKTPPQIQIHRTPVISRAQFTSKAANIIRGYIPEFVKKLGNEAAWWNGTSKAERNAIIEKMVSFLMDKGRVSFDDLYADFYREFPWDKANVNSAFSGINRYAKFAAEHKNASDFYVQYGKNGLESAGARNIFRGADAEAKNNNVRKQFRDYIFTYYKGNVPQHILDKMTDFDGKGHPLSAKRIGLIYQEILKEEAIRLNDDLRDIFPGKTLPENGFPDSFGHTVAELCHNFQTPSYQVKTVSRLIAVATKKFNLNPNDKQEILTRLNLNNVNKCDDLIKKLYDKIKETAKKDENERLVLELGSENVSHKILLRDDGSLVSTKTYDSLVHKMQGAEWMLDYIEATDIEDFKTFLEWIDNDAYATEKTKSTTECSFAKTIAYSLFPQTIMRIRKKQPNGPIDKATWCRELGLSNINLNKDGEFALALFSKVRKDYCEARGWKANELDNASSNIDNEEIDDDEEINEQNIISPELSKKLAEYKSFLTTLESGLPYDKKLNVLRGRDLPTNSDYLGKQIIPHSIHFETVVKPDKSMTEDAKKTVISEMASERSQGAKYFLNGTQIYEVVLNNVEPANNVNKPDLEEEAFNKMKDSGLTPQQIYALVHIPNKNEVGVQVDFGFNQNLHDMKIELTTAQGADGPILTMKLTTECIPLEDDQGSGNRPKLSHTYTIYPNGKIKSGKMELIHANQ